MISLDEKEYKMWKILEDADFPTFLVGGAVRDIIIGKIPHDYDFCTTATPDEIIDLFKSNGYHNIDYVGKSFGVVIVDGVEIATFRSDRYANSKLKEVKYIDHIFLDLSRRDFTINAMAIDFSGKLIDIFDGKKDLTNSPPMIKFVGDAKERIKEDPNRIFRACRFVASLHGAMDVDTLKAIQDAVKNGVMSKIAPDRIHDEIIKCMQTSQTASIFWEYLRITGILNIMIPDLVRCFNHPHGNHHIEDVWKHSMIAGDRVSCKFPLVKLATYLHDVGKPASYDYQDQTFIDHQKLGTDIVREFLSEFRFSSDEIRKITNLVLIHMDGTRNMSVKACRRLMAKIHRYGLDWHEWLRVRIGDRAGNLAKTDFRITDIKKYIHTIKESREVPFTTHQLELKGGEIIELFGIRPGPKVSIIQNRVLNEVIDGTLENDREKIITFIKENLL